MLSVTCTRLHTPTHYALIHVSPCFKTVSLPQGMSLHALILRHTPLLVMHRIRLYVFVSLYMSWYRFVLFSYRL